MNHPTIPEIREDAVVNTAASRRRQCICEEDPANGPCECAVPVAREQVGRLRAYTAQHPERKFIICAENGEWMSALAEFLPPGEDSEARVYAWMLDPYSLPEAADLHSSPDLGTLLDLLDAPPAAILS